MEFLMPNKEQFPAKPCTIETIDTGFVEHLDKEFNIHVFTNSGFKKVPIIWVGSERAFQVKANSSLRDSSGKLILPIITVQRTALQKDPSFKGGIQAHFGPNNQKGREYLGGAYRLVTKINQVKTSQRRIAKNISGSLYAQSFSDSNPSGTEVVYDEFLIPLPTYVSITYSVTLRCEYQQQMNQMVLPFITKTGQINHFVFTKDNHRFESFIQQDFAASNNLSNMSEEERKFETKIDIKVLGYLIGEGVNETRPKIVKRESVAKLSTAVETVIPIGISLPVRSSTDTANLTVERSTGGTTTSNDECVWLTKIPILPLEMVVAARSKLIRQNLPFQSANPDFSPRDITDIIDGVLKGEETLFNERDIALELTEKERRVKVTNLDEDCDDE
jgi:hypothetical protein